MYKSRKPGAILSLIILLSFVFSPVAAQNPSNFYVEVPRTFFGGVIMGANFSQVDGDAYAGYYKTGINGGAVLYARINRNFAASLELLYSQKGSRSVFSQFSTSRQYTITDQNIKLNYVEFPLQLNYFDKHKSHVGAGLSYSRLISSSESITSQPANTYDESKYPFRKSDLNIIAGGQLHLWKGLFAGLRFQYSLIPIRKNFDPEFGRAAQYNNMWTVRVMYLFD
jgi:hypothetical protein